MNQALYYYLIDLPQIILSCECDIAIRLLKMNCIIVTNKNRYVPHPRTTTHNSTYVFVVRTKDEIYSPSDITAKPYYLKRNYQDLQMLKTLVYYCSAIHSECIFMIIIWH